MERKQRAQAIKTAGHGIFRGKILSLLSSAITAICYWISLVFCSILIYQSRITPLINAISGTNMSHRIVFLLCLITLSPVCAMQKFQNYLQQHQRKKQAPAFMDAAREGDLSVLKAMLASGIDVNITEGILGCSALMVASSALECAVDRRPSDAIRLLVAHGACVNQINDIGYSAIDWALYSRDQDSLCFLLKNSRTMHPFKKNSCPQEVLERHKIIAPDNAAFLAECIEHVNAGESRTVAEMVLIGQGFPSVITNTILPYIGHEETPKEREQTIKRLKN